MVCPCMKARTPAPQGTFSHTEVWFRVSAVVSDDRSNNCLSLLCSISAQVTERPHLFPGMNKQHVTPALQFLLPPQMNTQLLHAAVFTPSSSSSRHILHRGPRTHNGSHR